MSRISDLMRYEGMSFEAALRVAEEEAKAHSPAPAGSASITGLQALIHCELWTRSDMNLVEDKRAFQHRLNVIRQGIAQLKERAKLSPDEQKAVDNFIAAAKALPSSICISVGDEDDDEHLSVSKRTTRGSAQQVAFTAEKVSVLLTCG